MQRTRARMVLAIAAVIGAAATIAAACGASDASHDASSPLNEQSTSRAGADSFDSTTSSKNYAAPAEAAKPAPPATGASAAASSLADTAAAGDAGGGTSLQSELDRKIIFNANITLRVDDVATAFSRVSAIARQQGGFVERSTYRQGDGKEDKGSATLTLRVPVNGYQDAVQGLRTLEGAKVDSEGSKSTEVTEQYTDLQSRLKNLERTEQQYLGLLAQAKTITDILTVTDRLDSIRGQIEQVQGRINVLEHATDLATIDVTLAPVVAAKAEPKNDGKSVGEAFTEAWQQSLDVVAGVARGGAVVAVAAIWLAIPLALVGFGASRYGRRHRRTPAAP